MVAYDRTGGSAGGRFPSDETLALVRGALARYLRQPADEESVCEALDALAREAHARRLRAEDMLVAFKSIWADLPEVNAIASQSERQQKLGRLISLCIDSYFRGKSS